MGQLQQGIRRMYDRRLHGMLCLVAVAALAGCWGPQSPPPAPPPVASAAGGPSLQPESHPVKPPADWTANEILQALLARYRAARTYRDQGIVRVAWRENGQPQADERRAAVVFERPGKLALSAYQATVRCDGKMLRARIEDAESRNLDGQFVVRPAPPELAIKDLAADRLLYNTICGRLRRQPVQLELLLESGGLVSAFGGDIACRRLEDERHTGRTCYRIQVPSPGGPFVFWVDQEQGLL